MPGSSHNHHRSNKSSRRRRSFFDRLFGRKRHSSRHSSSFPGITLPEDYDPAAGMKRHEEAVSPADIEKPVPEEIGKDFSDSTPDKLETFKIEEYKEQYPRGKRSLSAFVRYYLKQREFRKEERVKQRIKRKMRKKQLKEYRRKESGKGFFKRLLFLSSEGDETTREHKVAFFSQNNILYKNLTILVNSTFIFLITYVLVYLFYWLTSMFLASWYGLDSIFYYYDLKFNDHSNLWTRFNILLVTGIPPFFSLFLGTYLYRVVFKKHRFTGLQKLFILWSSFHLFNHFFGAFPAGIITDEGFGYVAAWMYMNTAFKFMFAIISLFVLGLIGYHSAEYILETSDSMNRIKTENRTAFIFTQVAIPWLIGTISLILLRMPENFNYPYETLMLFSMVFMVIPPFFNEKVKPKLNLLRVKKRRNINLGYLVMMLLLIAFLRLMLGIGLHFVINIDISISPANI